MKFKKSNSISKIVSVSILSMMMLFVNINVSSADTVVSENDFVIENTSMSHENKTNKVRLINTIRYKAVNVFKTRGEEVHRRVSNSYGRGASITVDRAATYNITATNADGIYSIGNSVTYRESATFHNTKYRKAYIACIAVYEVERGTKVVYDALTGKEYSRSPYSIKRPVSFYYNLVEDRN